MKKVEEERRGKRNRKTWNKSPQAAKLSAYVSSSSLCVFFPLVCQGRERSAIFFKGEKSSPEGSVFAYYKGSFDQSYAWACHPFLLTNRGPFWRVLAKLVPLGICRSLTNPVSAAGCSLKFYAANLSQFPGIRSNLYFFWHLTREFFSDDTKILATTWWKLLKTKFLDIWHVHIRVKIGCNGL